MGKATEEQLNNPLHGVKLIDILNHLTATLGWKEMAERVPINCFKTRPTIKSSLRFLRKTEWARRKVENLYLSTLPKKVHPSVPKMWEEFTEKKPEYKNYDVPDSWHFHDNEKDAKVAAKQVQEKIKQSTSTSLWWFEQEEEVLPQKGDIHIVTDWYGIAKAIITVNKVEKIAFKNVTEQDALLEGSESLEEWKKEQWSYYKEEMKAHDEEPSEDMLIVFERFETIWS